MDLDELMVDDPAQQAPLMAPEAAVAKAQGWLDGQRGTEGLTVQASSLVPNTFLGIWLVWYTDDAAPDIRGNALAVREGEDPWAVPDGPLADEYVGARFPGSDADLDDQADDEEDLAALVDIFAGSEEDALLRLFAPEALVSRPGDPETARPPAPEASPPAKKGRGPGYPTRMKPTKTGDPNWDESAHPRGDAGTPKGGRFIPKGSGGGAGKKAPAKKAPAAPAKKPPKLSKAQRVQRLMEGILKALGPLMADLSGPQVQALMEKIKKNAEAFINGQAAAPHHGGGGHKGGSGGGKQGGPAAKKAAPGRGSPSSPAGAGQPGGGGGGGGDAALVKSVINSVKGLLDGWADKMEPGQRRQLQDAIKGLENAAAGTETLASGASADPEDPSIMFAAIPHDDAVVHYIGPEEKHATLAYFGEPSASEDGQRMLSSKALFLDCARVVAGSTPPFAATVRGVEPLGDSGAQVWMLDSPELQALFEALGGGDSVDSELDSMYQDSGATKYPEYTPHVTVGYRGSDEEPGLADEDLEAAQDVVAIPFDAVALWWGDERHEFPLTGQPDSVAASGAPWEGELRVPKGNGGLSGRWVDSPGKIVGGLDLPEDVADAAASWEPGDDPAPLRAAADALRGTQAADDLESLADADWTLYDPGADSRGDVGAGGEGDVGSRVHLGEVDPAWSVAKYITPDGHLSPERQALHDRIVAKYLGDVRPNPSGEKTFTFMGGGPAAGKSTIVNSDPGNFPSPESAVFINADDIKGDIPEYQEGLARKDPGAAAYVHEESSMIAMRLRQAAIARGLDVVLDGTGDHSAEKMGGKLDEAREAGYTTRGIYATVPIEEALARAQARGEKTGRFIPPAYLEETHRSVASIVPDLAPRFDGFELYDTTTKPPTLLARNVGGRLVVADQAKYDAFRALGEGRGK
jgi:predicted ABC-type ATPase